ncbi:MAG TPA: hypothetical protein VFB21_02980 [Chthonomonadaceae bacterium]|nr:hypothetical protein [Chthonomonadaceae bacterium]
MSEQQPPDEERGQGPDLHPRHESWARLTTRNNLIGFAIALALIALFVIGIEISR